METQRQLRHTYGTLPELLQEESMHFNRNINILEDHKHDEYINLMRLAAKSDPHWKREITFYLLMQIATSNTSWNRQRLTPLLLTTTNSKRTNTLTTLCIQTMMNYVTYTTNYKRLNNYEYAKKERLTSVWIAR
eukprot:3181174-Amphidinium_carterae.2